MSLATASAFAGVNQLKPVATAFPQHAPIAKIADKPMSRAKVQPGEKVALNAATVSAKYFTNFATLKGVNFGKKAKADEVVEIEATEYAVPWEYYADTEDWYCAFYSQDNQYLVRLDILSEELVGEFGYNDLDLDYSWGTKDGVSFMYTDASVVVSEGAAPGAYDVEATLVTDMGETLHCVVKQLPHEPEDLTFEGTDMSFCTYYDFDSDWYISITDGVNRLYLDLVNAENPGEFTGTYGIDDILDSYTYYLNNGSQHFFTDINVVAVANDEDPNVACEITGTGVLDNGDKLTFHFLQLPPIEPESTVTVAESEILAYEFGSVDLGGYSFFQVAGDGMTFTVVYNGTLGEFSGKQINVGASSIALADGSVVVVDHANVVVAVDADNNVGIEASIVGKNAVEYVVSAAAPIEIAANVEIVAHNLEISDLFGLIYFLDCSNDEYMVEGLLPYYPTEGDITEDVSFSVQNLSTEEITSSIVVKSASITASESGIIMDAEFIGQDNVLYTVTADFQIPEIDSEADWVGEDLELDDLSADLGAIQICGYNENDDWISFVIDMDELTAGHYTELSQYYASYCTLTYDGVPYNMYSCDVELALVGDDAFTLNGTCQAGSTLFHVAISGWIGGNGGNEYDQEEDAECTFTKDQIEEFSIYEEDGFAYLRASNGEEMFATLIYIDGDELEAGTYEINDTYEVGSVQPGAISGSSVYPTFYATLTEDGYLNVPLFFCVEGTVTVSYDAEGDPIIVCDATNTWGCSGHFEVNNDGGQVAIENVAAQKANNGKFFQNYQVLIRNNGKQYNAFGQMMK